MTILGISRHLQDLAQQLRLTGIVNTEEKERMTALRLEATFSVIDVLEKRLRVLIRGQLSKINIMRECLIEEDD